jgi:rhodanese-related sulfurtransferase
MTPQSTMQEILEAFPGGQRALFRKYHIGGCSHCSFQPDETLASVCQRNNHLDPNQVLAFLQESHAEDEKVLLSPQALAKERLANPSLKLLDVRSRQEFEAVHIEGSILMSQPTMQEIMSQWPRETLMVVIDHRGRNALDAAAYFAGHGFTKVRCLQGGIDAWSEHVDSNIPRYRLA